MKPVERFQELKKQHVVADDIALSNLFDSLEPVTCEEIRSKWRGGGFDTGHWLLQVLVDMKWYGKWLVSKLDAKPLICFDEKGNLSSSQAMNGEASLWMMEFRGKVSATVVYDGVPMFGHLRKVDDNTLLGVVNGKTLPNGQEVVQDGRHQYFYLERVAEFPAKFVE
ncbi:DUF4334 domain-containing protein [Granulicella sp. dw_53]|uniref:DUF4334 domain-containing protein n=1 Tax=Granulicella sp. dw_53 TaxID=2719792 RepID=UPI001BD46072|nr:DUF4334 domain-containing protein [Granulicella sp. dw_53]